MRLSLAWKLLLGYVLVVAVSISTFALLANRSTERELRLMMGQAPQGTALAAEQLAAYYRGRGSWEGVERLFPAAQHMGGGMGRGMQAVMGLPAVLDAQGLPLLGGLAGQQDVENAIPILVDGRVVGYVLPAAESGASLAERDLVARVNRAILLAALLSIGAALVVAALLTTGMLRPVRELTSAARALAGGDLTRRVRVHTRDEVGELSEAFNHMAGSLQHAEALRRDMTADIAHELRNPLSVMQARVEAVMDGVYAPTPANLQPVLEQTQLLSRLVEDLRTLALADAGQLPLERTEISLRGLLERTVNSYRAQAQATGVELRLTVPEASDVRAQADPGRIEQVLGNLLANALRHAPGGTAVDVRLEVLAGMARIEIADDGEGIPAEALPYMFERFYRADRARSREQGGTGLGLAISRQIVQAHGGTITAANRPEGGAAFMVALPATRISGAAGPQ
jgi:two-component system, OmpR family, sensor histidine kinase BaeS